jgi:signal transduction histidine kinase
MTLIAQSIAPAWRRDPAEGERRVNRLLELSQAALAEMRALLAELRPPETPSLAPAPQPQAPTPGIIQMQRDGLVAALQSHIAHIAGDGLQIKLNPAGYVRQSLEQEEALYRIAQEALNNVVKHARAQCVQIKLDVDAEAIHLQVIDDGVGLRPKSNPSARQGDEQRSGLGLLTMRERAETLGGTVQLGPVPGGGTTVSVTLPRRDRNSAD